MSSRKRKQPQLLQEVEDESPSAKRQQHQSLLKHELFFGNLSPAVTNKLLEEFVVATLLHLGLVPSNERSMIVNCKVVRLGTLPYAFVDFATPEMAMEALVLDNVPFMGTQLSIRLPDKSNAKGEPKSLIRWDDLVVRDLPAAEQYKYSPIRSDDRLLCLSNITPEMTDDLLILFLNSASLK